ncbi:hypothetical protein [Roseibium aquae]|uniref:hypothetical protein n=1 Tax=Roseibium aquae TaxID=1323746 RepID=UPI00123E3A9C|nr:hypothetical protein [Roseibium aquae]
MGARELLTAQVGISKAKTGVHWKGVFGKKMRNFYAATCQYFVNEFRKEEILKIPQGEAKNTASSPQFLI